jgi:acid-sensing ion channel 5
MITPAASNYIRDTLNGRFNMTATTLAEMKSKFVNVNQFYQNVEQLIYETYDPKFNLTLKKSFGYDLDTMIQISIYFNKSISKTSIFEWYYHINFGNCFKFNSKAQRDGYFYTSKFQDEGLKLILFNGIDGISLNSFFEPKFKGFRILIEDQNSFPISKEGILVKPSSYTKIGFYRVETETLPHPYSECVSADKVDTLISREMKTLGMKYTRRNCLDLCRVKNSIDQIGCADWRYPQILNATPCQSFSKAVNIKYNFDNYLKYCPFECKTISFDLTISNDDYPTYFHFSFLNSILGEKYKKLFRTPNVTYEMFKKSFTYVFIEMEDLKVTNIKESPTITLTDLLASIGGTIGFFIGVSILSLVNIISLMIEIILLIKKHASLSIRSKL